LPGGDFESQQQLLTDLAAEFPWLDTDLLEAWIKRYGTLIRVMLGDAKTLDDLGVCFGADLYECEVRYLMREEWAQTAEDIMWRRTKSGLRLNAEQRASLTQFCESEQTLKAKE
jgi:glycerol-3-phosphate dehydrogenase